MISNMRVHVVQQHWLVLKRRHLLGDVIWLSEEGVTLVGKGHLKMGARVHLTLETREHCLKNIPAQIVRAEPCLNGARYSLRFYKQTVIDRGGKATLELLRYLAQNFKL